MGEKRCILSVVERRFEISRGLAVSLKEAVLLGVDQKCSESLRRLQPRCNPGVPQAGGTAWSCTFLPRSWGRYITVLANVRPASAALPSSLCGSALKTARGPSFLLISAFLAGSVVFQGFGAELALCLTAG